MAWAAEAGLRCADERLLSPVPFDARTAWCRSRIAETEDRLAAILPETRIILVNHWPLRRDHAILPRIPRFSIWCGTRATEDWHRRFAIDTVIYGHLAHRARRGSQDGVRFEEVSLGIRSNGIRTDRSVITCDSFGRARKLQVTSHRFQVQNLR